MRLRNMKSFSNVSVDLSSHRTTFHKPHTVTTTFNTGKLIPMSADLIYPGDTVSMNTSFVLRSQTPIFPVMDNAYIDVFHYFVPMRLIWPDWKEFMGERKKSMYETVTPKQVPTVKTGNADNATFQKGSVADFLNYPVGVKGIEISQLELRAYARIWNDCFRDQNIQDEAFQLTATSQVTLNSSNVDPDSDPLLSATYGGALLPVSKYGDYFTTALPKPQKGDPVTLGFNDVPVIAKSTLHNVSGTAWHTNGTNGRLMAIGSTGYMSETTSSQVATGNPSGIQFNNAYALTSENAFTVNQLREAFQTQKMLERDARGGTRYNELVLSHFGVRGDDARLQYAEFLGGEHITIDQNQVASTAYGTIGQDGIAMLGQTGAYSLTGATNDGAVQKSFTEHGIMMTVICVRTDHTYGQGIRRDLSYKDRLDFYFPVFANLGEQEVLKQEIYADGSATDKEIFGYQEKWSEMRYKPSYVTNEMRSTHNLSQDYKHYADHYTQHPTLNSSWISETTDNVDRTLAITSNVACQWQIQMLFNTNHTRVLPAYSEPGKIDHN